MATRAWQRILTGSVEHQEAENTTLRKGLQWHIMHCMMRLGEAADWPKSPESNEFSKSSGKSFGETSSKSFGAHIMIAIQEQAARYITLGPIGPDSADHIADLASIAALQSPAVAHWFVELKWWYVSMLVCQEVVEAQPSAESVCEHIQDTSTAALIKALNCALPDVYSHMLAVTKPRVVRFEDNEEDYDDGGSLVDLMPVRRDYVGEWLSSSAHRLAVFVHRLRGRYNRENNGLLAEIGPPVRHGWLANIAYCLKSLCCVDVRE